MNYSRSLRAGTSLMATAVIILLIAINLGGCSDSQTSVTNPTTGEAPVLPVPEQLQFDFSFFEPADKLDKSDHEYDNFINAYLRTVVLDVMARLVLAAPVEAFSNAINTVPEAQPDGSWRWTYDWQLDDDTVGIVLIGLPVGDVVEWELRLVPEGSTIEYLWFYGTTSDRCEQGHWVFLDLDDENFPVCGEIAWGHRDQGDFLEFISREIDSNGDSLVFYDNDPEFRIEFTSGTGTDPSFIQWNAAGDGSLEVPDYNNGERACWDIHQRNVECP